MEARIGYPMARAPHILPMAWLRPLTVEELGATALASCIAAAGHYAALAEEMGRHGQSELAAVFERLAVEQKALQRAIVGRGARPREDTAQAASAAWAGAQGFSDRDEEAQNPHLSNPYKALAFAVRNAERAFRFYSYVAATAESDSMRTLAEWLATEELARAAQLRVRRRRAYHTRRAAGRAARAPDPKLVDSVADLLLAAAVMERRISRHLADAAAAGAGLSSLADKVRRHADDLTRAPNGRGPPGPAMTRAVAGLAEAAAPAAGGDEKTPFRAVGLALAEGERAFAFYSAVVGTAANETVMLEAQRLSRNALDVISILRSHTA